MSEPAHPLTLWLARASVTCYVVAVMIGAASGEASPKTFRIWRATWSVACLLLIVHVLAAFHFEHDWSHAAAFRHTAEQTARVTGFDWGDGLYFNYAFMALWLLDVVFLWRVSGSRPSILRRITDMACIFMVFNATVVFGPRWWMVPALAGALSYWQLRRQISAGTDGNRTVED